MSQTVQRRTEVHASGEPDQLFGEFGEPLRRGVYSHTASNGKELWVCISTEGRVIASVPIPSVPQRDPGGLKAQDWQHSLGRSWLAIETLDPCDDPRVHSYPDFFRA